MFKNVFTKTLYDRRWALLGWFLGMAFLAWMIGLFYSNIGQSKAFAEQLKTLPPALRSVVGNTNDLSSVPGYFGSQLFGKTMPMVVAILGVLLGVGLATEEEAGTLQTLLATPVRRGKVIVDKWLAVVVVLLLITVGVGLGLYLTLWQQHLIINNTHVAESLLMTWLAAIAFFGVTFAVAAASGRRGLTIAVGSIYAIGAYMVHTLSAAVDSLKTLDKFTPFYYYGDGSMLRNGIKGEYVAILAAASIALLIVAVLAFSRRDLQGN